MKPGEAKHSSCFEYERLTKVAVTVAARLQTTPAAPRAAEGGNINKWGQTDRTDRTDGGYFTFLMQCTYGLQFLLCRHTFICRRNWVLMHVEIAVSGTS
jgi:hypothetical protein